MCAVVVLNNDAKSKLDSKVGQPLTLRQLRAWAKERLAPYKVHVCFSTLLKHVWYNVLLFPTLFKVLFLTVVYGDLF